MEWGEWSNPYLFSQSSHSLIPYISHQYLARQRGDLWKVGALSLNILHSWSQSCLFLLAKNGGYHGYAVCRVSGWWFQAVVVLSMGWSLDQNDVNHHPQPVMECSPLPSAIVSAMCTVLIIYKTHMHKWLIVIYGYAMKLHELASRFPGKRGQPLFGTRICLVCATHVKKIKHYSIFFGAYLYNICQENETFAENSSLVFEITSTRSLMGQVTCECQHLWLTGRAAAQLRVLFCAQWTGTPLRSGIAGWGDSSSTYVCSTSTMLSAFAWRWSACSPRQCGADHGGPLKPFSLQKPFVLEVLRCLLKFFPRAL